MSIKGVGTANAMAEARLSPQELAEFCTENAHHYQSAAACLKQKQSEFGTKIFRASADCTAGRITTTGDMAYTLDGLWDASDIGSGRTRWKDADRQSGRPRSDQQRSAHLAAVGDAVPGPRSLRRSSRVRRAGRLHRTAAQRRAVRRVPARRACAEVASFAAAITDFRASQYDQNTKAVSATVRFVNKTNRPLILGYVRGGNRRHQRSRQPLHD